MIDPEAIFGEAATERHAPGRAQGAAPVEAAQPAVEPDGLAVLGIVVNELLTRLESDQPLEGLPELPTDMKAAVGRLFAGHRDDGGDTAPPAPCAKCGNAVLYWQDVLDGWHCMICESALRLRSQAVAAKAAARRGARARSFRPT